MQVDENPSQSRSFWQGTGTRLVVVVLLAKVDDVLIVVLLVDVLVPRTSPIVVVVWSGICPPPGVVVVGPPIVVVLVVAGGMHRSERGVGRQRSMSFAGAAPAVSAMRSARALRAGTVNVCVRHVVASHTGSSKEQVPSHSWSTSQDAVRRPDPSVRLAITPSRHTRRIVRADASSAAIVAANASKATTTPPEISRIARSPWGRWYHHGSPFPTPHGRRT